MSQPKSRVTTTQVSRYQILGSDFKMMGLGNGRRSMKSSPLILAALVACIIVLGFNYWIASTRSMALQTRVVELEGRVRMAAAERGAVELKKNEFQGELEKQREQLDRIRSSHSFQLESVNKLYQDEKAALVNNITTGEKFIRDLQDQLKALQRSYGRLQQDIFQFERNQSNLEKKFSYDLSQCINQMKEVKEQCEEQTEEVTNKRNEAVISKDAGENNDQSHQLHTLIKPQPGLQEIDLLQSQVPQGKGHKSQTPAPSSDVVLYLKTRKGNKETNKIQIVSGEEPSKDSLGPPQLPGQEQATVKDTPWIRRGQLTDTTQVPAILLARAEDQNSEDLEHDQLVVHGKNQQRLEGQHDYNVDENKESERDRQAALVGNDQSINGLSPEPSAHQFH
uniref:Golgi membrane protein 1 isoform X4 n=1 Tax=Jaculus jaculus TaxID=51337 RepID=UPI001E1B56C7|nr:Golgi membrane protein 1 isoform X4 [Jaculus jaculus]